MGSAGRLGEGITKLTNCRLLRGDELVVDDVWISSTTGRILRSQAAFYDDLTLPDRTIDLGGRIVSPGFIDCQLNGAFGFNFSTVFEDMSQYESNLRDLNSKLVETGVTSYIPTVTSQTGDLYKAVLPYLGPSGKSRNAREGAESLGAHVEGPFLNPDRNGVHNVGVLRQASTLKDIDDMYGANNADPVAAAAQGKTIPIKMITVAPELGQMTKLIPSLCARGIVCSIGHSDATYEEASDAVAAGASMITHLFNAMAPLHHRNPGPFGVLGVADHPGHRRPYFGIIADGIHLHPATTKIAWNAHPDGLILVTDAMHMAGLPDGEYPWTNGTAEHFIVKTGAVLRLRDSDTIAGSSTILIDCVNNFLRWSGASVPKALGSVTATPAAMLGLRGVKGTLDPSADADLVILSEETHAGDRTPGLPSPSSSSSATAAAATVPELVVDEVWKFGVKIFERSIVS